MVISTDKNNLPMANLIRMQISKCCK